MNPADRGKLPEGGATGPISDVEGVLLCAGVGKRLGALTADRPKALVPVAGRPVLNYHLTAWQEVGIRRAVLVTGHLREQVEEYVGDGARFGLEVDYAFQPERRGTGDALRAARGSVRTPWLLVGYADVFFGEGVSLWRRLVADRRPKIVGARVPNAGSYGRLLVDHEGSGGHLLGIQEKDRLPTPGLVNAGAYLLPHRVLELTESIAPSPRGEFELTDAVTAWIAEGGEVEVVPTPSWVDIGTPEHLETASRMARESSNPPSGVPGSPRPARDHDE